MEVKPGYKQTEVGVIPEEWEVSGLHKACRGTITYGIVQCGPHVKNGVPYIRVSDMDEPELDVDGMLRTSSSIAAKFARSTVYEGDIVYALRGKLGEVRSVGRAVAGANLTQGTARLSPSERLNGSYLLWAMRSARSLRQAEMEAKGTTFREITLADLRQIKIPVPPIPEQRAIAEVLGDVDALLGSLEQLIAKKRDLKQAAMQQLLTGKKRLPGFRGEWEMKRFGEITFPRKERVDPRRSGIQEFCVELEHIKAGTGNLVGSNSTGDNSSLKSVFRKGDVLFGKLRAYLRKYWLADRAGVCSTEIWVFAPGARLIMSAYLFQLVQSDHFIESASTAYGTHMPRSDWNVVKNYELRLPSLPEQTAIAEVLSDMDAELAALEQRLAKTRPLKQGMMQELLTGRTRLV